MLPSSPFTSRARSPTNLKAGPSSPRRLPESLAFGQNFSQEEENVDLAGISIAPSPASPSTPTSISASPALPKVILFGEDKVDDEMADQSSFSVRSSSPVIVSPMANPVELEDDEAESHLAPRRFEPSSLLNSPTSSQGKEIFSPLGSEYSELADLRDTGMGEWTDLGNETSEEEDEVPLSNVRAKRNSRAWLTSA